MTEHRRIVIADITDPQSNERMRIERMPALPELELTTVYDSLRVWRVFHEAYDICLVPVEERNDPTGAAYYTYRGRMETLRAGGMALTEPGEVHAVQRMVRPSNHYWFLRFDPALMRSAAEELGVPSPPHFNVAASYSPRLFHALSKLHESFGDDVLVQQSRLAETLRVLFEECGETRPRPFVARAHHGLQRAREYLHAHFAESIRLDELAVLAGVNKFHFVRLFAKTYGMSPHAYQTQLRLAFARAQLRAGIPPAAIEAGFADQSHFTRHFKRAWGVTPGAYANGRRHGEAPALHF